MAWPLASHFRVLLSSPRVAFRDPELQACTIERDSLGQPRAWAGAFAVVYKGIDPAGNARAIRVFSTESPERRERYDAISSHANERRLASMVDFEYRASAIRSASDGRWYPLVLMEWVEGQTLFDWLACQCRGERADLIATAAEHWLAVIQELGDAGIAHGDLQHANVLVTPEGRLKLVDYDGMCVPSLAGRRNLEVGVPPYQHPQRNGETLLSPELDDFSALLIYVALRALSIDPRLWRKHVEQPSYDKMLFRVEDFREPGASMLRRDLLASPDSQVRALCDCLFTAARGDMAEVPFLLSVARNCPAAAAPASDLAPLLGAISPEAAAGRKRGEPAAVRRQAWSAAPATLADYEIGEPIGRGPWGAVYKGVRKKDGERVAIKIISAARAVTAQPRRRLLIEMDRVRQFRHGRIARLMDCTCSGNAVHQVCEYCEGGNLAQLVDRSGGRLALAQAAPLMLQGLDALQYAHQRHVVHGDLKPENILVETAGAAPALKLTDFALAATLEALGFGASGGSPVVDYRFTPRDRLTGPRGSRPVADLWSLAAVFYHVLSGQLPRELKGRDPMSVILSDDPPSLRQRDPTVPAGVADVIDRALRANPIHRYRTASEMKSALQEAVARVAVG